MRKLVISNMMSLDGYYEGKAGDMGSLFEYYPDGDRTVHRFDAYNNERTRAADLMLINGRQGFIGSKEYWSSVPGDPKATANRHEFARLIKDTDKIVISDHLTADELGDWGNTRIIKRDDAAREIATLKEQGDGDIVMFGGRKLWHRLIIAGLIDELHLAIYPMLAGGGTPVFEGQPGVTLKLINTRTWQDSGVVIVCYSVSRE